MILCTENDNNFINYKDKVKNRIVIFTIKQISKDWWNNFLDSYPNLNIRNIVFLNIERVLKCQHWDSEYAVYKCSKCGKEKLFLILVNLECVFLSASFTILALYFYFYIR